MIEKKIKNSKIQIFKTKFPPTQNIHGNTPLHFTLAEGEGDDGGFISEYLIEKGADVP